MTRREFIQITTAISCMATMDQFSRRVVDVTNLTELLSKFADEEEKPKTFVECQSCGDKVELDE